MSRSLAASKQSSNPLRLLIRRNPTNLPPLLRHLSAESIHPSPPPSRPSHNTLATQIVTLLQANENDWTNDDELRRLLFASTDSSPSISPLLLYKITRNLGTTTKALKFFDYLRANSSSPPDPPSLSSAFHAIFELASHDRANSPFKLSELFTIFKEHSIPLNVNSATLLVRCFGQSGMVEKSLLVYKELDPDLRNTHIRNVLVNALLRDGRIDDALQVLDEMLIRHSKSPPNDNTVDIVMAALLLKDRNGRSVSEEEIVGLVKKFGEHGLFPSAVRLTQFITKLCRSGKSDRAWDVLHDVMDLGGDVQASSCNALLVGLGRHQHFPKMNKLLVEMKEKDIQPDVITFGILINHLCKFRRVDEALEVFEKMSGGSGNGGFSVTPDTILYNTLIDGLCKVGRQEKGLGLMEQMRLHQGCAPNTVTYNCLIDGFCKAGEMERANELFDQMNKVGIAPNVVTLNILVDGMCRHGRVNSAVEFFYEMQGKGLKANAVTYTALIKAFCNANNIDKAMQLFNEMSEIECSPDAIVYYTLIAGLTQAGRLDDASFVASAMKKAGFCLDVVSYNILIGGFCRKNKLDKAYQMLKEMEQAGVKPDGITYNTLISHFCKTGDLTTAHRVMRKMISDGLVPTVVTFGALIHAYCLVGNLDEAMKIFRDMSSGSRVPPNTVIYNILIDCLCKNKKVEVALSLMDDMKDKGVRPNTTTYNAMLKGLQDINWLEKAFELMNQMTEQACNPDYVTMEILTHWLSAVGEAEKLRSFVQGYEVSASTA
ncbi:RNA helicase [Sarracenia purpurea var. burkii]